MRLAIMRTSFMFLMFIPECVFITDNVVKDTSIHTLESDSSNEIYFTVNGSKSLTVDPRMDLTFYCYIYGATPASAVVKGPGDGRLEDHHFNDGSVQFSLSGVTCRDGGQYFCQTLTTTGQASQSKVDVNVKCVPLMRYPQASGQFQSIQTSPNIYTDLTFEIFSHPGVDQFEIMFQQGDRWLEVDSDKYSASYLSGNAASGWASLVIYDLNYENTTLYKFIMRNTMGTLEHRIRVVKSYPKNNESSDGTWLGIGLGITCGIVLIMVAATCYSFLRARGRGDMRSELTFSDVNFNLSKQQNGEVFQGQLLDTYKPTHTEMMTVL